VSERICIGAVSYLNTLPLVYGMERGMGGERIELSYAVPSTLADRMQREELDIALMPIVELSRIPGLELVPGLAIVTQGKSASVLLIANCPIEQVQSVALDRESRSSNALARVLFAQAWNLQPDYVTGEPRLPDSLRRCDAVVRIGDKALFEPIPEGAHVYDLGEVWTARTGLPFVFAAWVARPGVVDREIYQMLHDSRREGCRNIDGISRDYTYDGRSYPEIAKEYLSRYIHYRLGSQELRAIRTFFESAAALKLVEGVPPIDLALSRETDCHREADRNRRTGT